MAKNDITGDTIKTKVSTQAYRDGWDRIFNKKNMNKEYVIVTAQWCGPCQSLKKQLEKENLLDKVRIVDVDEDVEFAKFYQIKSVPQMIHVQEDSVFTRYVGAADIITELKT